MLSLNNGLRGPKVKPIQPDTSSWLVFLSPSENTKVHIQLI